MPEIPRTQKRELNQEEVVHRLLCLAEGLPKRSRARGVRLHPALCQGRAWSGGSCLRPAPISARKETPKRPQESTTTTLPAKSEISFWTDCTMENWRNICDM